jgi:hypothetical protein
MFVSRPRSFAPMIQAIGLTGLRRIGGVTVHTIQH